MTGRLASIAALALAAAACQPPPELVRGVDAATADGPCQVCAAADLCCAAKTANPDSNCELNATCLRFTGEERAGVLSGCSDYLRAASTPPAPAVCGPHPDAE